VELRVFGQPAGQGSKRPVIAGNGRLRTVEQSKRVAPWRQDVRAAAEAFVQRWEVEYAYLANRWTPLDGPLVVAMVFTLPKPKSAPKTRKTWPHSAPDAVKLARGVEDELTLAGIWKDDARVVEYVRLAKCFPGEDPDSLRSPGALIRIWTMAEWRGE
jgi:Holliday junction resolvase RusA-like endonuclease